MIIFEKFSFTFLCRVFVCGDYCLGYDGETVTKKEVQLEKELGELNSEYYTLTADYNMQRQKTDCAETGSNRSSRKHQFTKKNSRKKIRV